MAKNGIPEGVETYPICKPLSEKKMKEDTRRWTVCQLLREMWRDETDPEKRLKIPDRLQHDKDDGRVTLEVRTVLGKKPMALQNMRTAHFDLQGKRHFFKVNARDRVIDIQYLKREVVYLENYTFQGCSINPGDVVIDGGAHVGIFSLYALLKGAKTVVSIEPSKTTFGILALNLAEYGDRSITIQKALWSEERGAGRRLRFRNGLSPMGARVLEHKSKNSPDSFALGTTIDGIVEQYGLSQVDFIKLDVEGSEIEALKGAVNTIKRFKPNLAVSLYHKPGDRDSIPAFVAGLGVYGEYKEKGTEYRGGLYINGIWGRE